VELSPRGRGMAKMIVAAGLIGWLPCSAISAAEHPTASREEAIHRQIAQMVPPTPSGFPPTAAPTAPAMPNAGTAGSGLTGLPPSAMPGALPGAPMGLPPGAPPLMPGQMTGRATGPLPGAGPQAPIAGMPMPPSMGSPGTVPMMPPNALPRGAAVPPMPPASTAGLPPGGTPRPSAPMGPGPDQIDNWISFAKENIKITDAQLPQWSAFADVIRGNSQKFADSRGGKANVTMPIAATIPERLDQMERYLTIQLELVKATKEALPALYKVLSDEQKKAADNYIRGPLGML